MKKQFDFECSEYCQLHAEVIQLRHQILHSSSKRHFYWESQASKECSSQSKIHIIPDVGGRNTYLLSKVKNLDSQLLLCCVFPALLFFPALLSVSSFSHKLLFQLWLPYLPHYRYCTNRLCICCYCVGFMCGLVSFFLFYLWTFVKLRCYVEQGQYLSCTFAEHKVQLKGNKSKLLIART